MSYVHPKHVNAGLHACACGCGTQVHKYDKNGKQRQFARGHHRRKQTSSKLVGVVIYFEPDTLAELRYAADTFKVSISQLVREELAHAMTIETDSGQSVEDPTGR